MEHYIGLHTTMAFLEAERGLIYTMTYLLVAARALTDMAKPGPWPSVSPP